MPLILTTPEQACLAESLAMIGQDKPDADGLDPEARIAADWLQDHACTLPDVLGTAGFAGPALEHATGWPQPLVAAWCRLTEPGHMANRPRTPDGWMDVDRRRWQAVRDMKPDLQLMARSLGTDPAFLDHVAAETFQAVLDGWRKLDHSHPLLAAAGKRAHGVAVRDLKRRILALFPEVQLPCPACQGTGKVAHSLSTLPGGARRPIYTFCLRCNAFKPLFTRPTGPPMRPGHLAAPDLIPPEPAPGWPTPAAASSQDLTQLPRCFRTATVPQYDLEDYESVVWSLLSDLAGYTPVSDWTEIPGALCRRWLDGEGFDPARPAWFRIDRKSRMVAFRQEVQEYATGKLLPPPDQT